MKRSQLHIQIFFVLIFIINSLIAQEKKIIITGNVIHENETPVSRAVAIFSTGNKMVQTDYKDTIYTSLNGKIHHEMLVDENAYGITYDIKNNFFVKASGYGKISQKDSINLNTIVLKAKINTNKIINLNGIIKDTTSNSPIAKTLIIFGKPGPNGWISKAIDSTFSSKNGSFSKNIQFDSTWIPWLKRTKRINYMAIKDGYAIKPGTIKFLHDTLDIGTIQLYPKAIKTISVSGIIKDSIENTPIPKALVILSTTKINSGISEKWDSVYTSDDGSFNKEIEIVEVSPHKPSLVYMVLSKLYRPKYGSKKIENNSVNIGTIDINKKELVTKEIEGTVLDSTTGNPIENALVIYSKSGTIVSIPDSIYTGSDGTFSKTLSYDPVLFNKIIFAVIKKGYRIKQGSKEIKTDPSIDLGNISIFKKPDNIISVIGMVIDLNSQGPIDRARVIISYNGISRVGTDTVYTNSDGTFSGECELTGTSIQDSIVSYCIEKDGYELLKGSQKFTTDPVDLGKFILEPIITKKIIIKQKKLSFKPNTIVIYSLKGQLLYSGLNVPIIKILNNYSIPSQPLIVFYKYQERIIKKCKIITIK